MGRPCGWNEGTTETVTEHLCERIGSCGDLTGRLADDPGRDAVMVEELGCRELRVGLHEPVLAGGDDDCN